MNSPAKTPRAPMSSVMPALMSVRSKSITSIHHFLEEAEKKPHLKLLFSRKRWPFLKSPTDILSFDPVFISQFIAKSSSASFRLQIYPLDLPSCLSLDTSPVGGSIAYKINQIYSCSCVSWLEKGVISIQFYGEKGNRIHASSGSNAMNITRDIFICQ